MYAHKIGEKGVGEHLLQEKAGQRADVLMRVRSKVSSGQYGFVDLVHTEDFVKLCEDVLEQIEWATSMVVIGIGGSDLGARAIAEALSEDGEIEVYFFGDSTDPNALDELLEKVDLGSTVFNIVSKSGSTLEPIVFYMYIKSIIKSRGGNWQKHFIFTTESEVGALKEEARKYEDIIHLPIPQNVGGRFSVLSTVGLFPALAMGIDARAMLSGAANVVKQLESDEPIPLLMAWEQYLLHEQGTRSVVLWPYSIKLNEFARWFRQLWAESLGKEGRGILPIAAAGPADQHSQLQFYEQGTFMSSYLFLTVQNYGSSHIIKNVDLEEYQHLAGKDFADIIKAEAQGTADSLVKGGRPVATLEVDQVSAYSLGELFMTFELAVTFLGEFLGINAFDQPGVEKSKVITKQLLGG